MLEILQAVDLGARAGTPAFTWDAVANEWMTKPADQSQKRLDYILGFGGNLRGEAISDPFEVHGRHLSDHFGVRARIEWAG